MLSVITSVNPYNHSLRQENHPSVNTNSYSELFSNTLQEFLQLISSSSTIVDKKIKSSLQISSPLASFRGIREGIYFILETESHWVAPAGLKLKILLPQPPNYRDYRHVTLCLAPAQHHLLTTLFSTRLNITTTENPD
jgi:hypothetical protein